MATQREKVLKSIATVMIGTARRTPNANASTGMAMIPVLIPVTPPTTAASSEVAATAAASGALISGIARGLQPLDDEIGHMLRGGELRAGRSEVRGPMAVAQGALDGGLERGGLLGEAE